MEPQRQVPSAIIRSDESNVAVGIALPQYGTIASPKTILHVAVEAEKMGLASLWTSDRLLLPTKPKETFDGDPWPETFATVYDPIEMLTFVAARTRKVKLRTSVMSALFQNPVTLARRFATLDRLSDGRADIPESRIGPKPVQPGGIPMLLGAFAPASLERAAGIADGIMPAAGRSTRLRS